MGHSFSSDRKSKTNLASTPKTTSPPALSQTNSTSKAMTAVTTASVGPPTNGIANGTSSNTISANPSQPATTPRTASTTPLPSFEGSIIAISGGASGIGLGTAKYIAARGAIPCIGDINPSTLDEASEYFTSQSLPFMVTKVDVSKREEVDGWIEAVVEKYGRLDGACNAAGIIGKVHGLCGVKDMLDEEWERIMQVNLTGMMYCVRAQLRKICDKGSIVNLSSVHGTKGFPMHSAYDCSKHAIVALTKAAALENGDREIRVNCVTPGSVVTPLMRSEWKHRGMTEDHEFKEPTAFKRYGTIEETANVIGFLLGPESRFVSGSVYAVDGAWQ